MAGRTSCRSNARLDEIGPGDGVSQFDVVKDEKTSFVSEEADCAYDLWLPLGRILLRETTLPVRQVGAGVSPTLDAGFKLLLPTEMSRSRCVVSTRQRKKTGKSRQTSSESEDVFDHTAQ